MSRGISFGTPASSSTRDHTIAVRVANARREQRLELLAVLVPRGRASAKRASSTSSGSAERAAQRCEVLLASTAAIWIQPSLVSVQAVARVDAG